MNYECWQSSCSVPFLYPLYPVLKTLAGGLGHDHRFLLNWGRALQDILAGGRRQKVEPRALAKLLPLQFRLLHCTLLAPAVQAPLLLHCTCPLHSRAGAIQRMKSAAIKFRSFLPPIDGVCWVLLHHLRWQSRSDPLIDLDWTWLVVGVVRI